MLPTCWTYGYTIVRHVGRMATPLSCWTYGYTIVQHVGRMATPLSDCWTYVYTIVQHVGRMATPLSDMLDVWLHHCPTCWTYGYTIVQQCWTYGYTIVQMVDPTFTRSFISSLFVWAVMDNGRRCLDVHLVFELIGDEDDVPQRHGKTRKWDALRRDLTISLPLLNSDHLCNFVFHFVTFAFFTGICSESEYSLLSPNLLPSV